MRIKNYLRHGVLYAEGSNGRVEDARLANLQHGQRTYSSFNFVRCLPKKIPAIGRNLSFCSMLLVLDEIGPATALPFVETTNDLFFLLRVFFFPIENTKDLRPRAMIEARSVVYKYFVHKFSPAEMSCVMILMHEIYAYSLPTE